MTNFVSPGWYPDPHDPTQEHWWDGTRYHGTRTVEAAATATTTPPTGAAAVPPPRTPANTEIGGYTPFRAGAISPKSRTVATILGLFGGLGVDRFYLGNIGMGVAKLLVGWLTFGIWPLVDWIIIVSGAAHDGDGLPVRNWE